MGPHTTVSKMRTGLVECYVWAGLLLSAVCMRTGPQPEGLIRHDPPEPKPRWHRTFSVSFNETSHLLFKRVTDGVWYARWFLACDLNWLACEASPMSSGRPSSHLPTCLTTCLPTYTPCRPPACLLTCPPASASGTMMPQATESLCTGRMAGGTATAAPSTHSPSHPASTWW